ncbi:sensor histidine kinase [Nocardioides sp. HB32]
MAVRLRLADVLVPAMLLLVGGVELVLAQPDGWGVGLLLEGLAAAVLVARRHAPLVVGTTAAVIVLAMPWVGPELEDVAAPILFIAVCGYSFARWIPGLRGLLGIGVILAVLLADYLVDPRGHDITDVVFVAALVLPPYVVGRITRRLADQAQQLREQQAVLTELAVRDERDRIARELHDVIAHSISAMVVQAAAAEDLVRTDPERAAGLLRSVTACGRRALDETGRLLHLVRDDADDVDELGLHPPPGVRDLPALVESFRAAGLQVDAELEPPDPLPDGVDLSAYRIVQEALTNAARHGRGAVRLGVGVERGQLRVRCVNQVAADDEPGSGLGLRGMGERVAMLRGTLVSGVTAEGFVVDVRLPLVPEPVW